MEAALQPQVVLQASEASDIQQLADEAEHLLNLFYDQDYLGRTLSSEDGEFMARRFGENVVAIRLRRLGGSVTILAQFEDEEFYKGRRLTKAGDTITQRHDFDLSSVSPTILAELKDARSAQPPVPRSGHQFTVHGMRVSRPKRGPVAPFRHNWHS